MKVDLSLAVAGPQGSGIESAGQIAIRAFAMKGYDVFGSREYHSNIVGAHSYYHIRVGKKSLKLPLDSLIALDAESVFTHLENLKKDALLICDLKSFEKKPSNIPSMSKALKNRILNAYGDSKLEEVLKKKDLRIVALNLKEMIVKLSDELKKPISSISRAINVMGLSVGLYLIGVGEKTIEQSIRRQFPNPEDNVRAMKIALEKVSKIERGYLPEIKKKKILLSGSEAVATAKIKAGLEFMSYYPITPATDEPLFIENTEIITVQAEDEIAAIGMALGASICGSRVSVSTSGPGFSLMNEMISFAVQAEIPIVITLWMRAGPSTGIATRTGQQDLLHTIFSGHGDCQKVVIASGNHEEAIKDVFLSFEISERFRVPVIHLLDKYLASSIVSIDSLEIENLFNRKNKIITKNFSVPQIFSGLEHDEMGFVTEDPIEREKMMLKRIEKFKKIDEFLKEKYKVYGEENAEVTIVSFGSTKNAIIDAIQQIDIPVKFIQIRVLSPFPRIKELEGKVLCIESNSGQLAFLLRNVDTVARKLNARPIYENEVVKAIKATLEGQKEVILSEGA
ncbi:MAG: 2-oxoacid:acceptor oxidoreductase family protein [Archaeoglobaceae archaeon]|nr:2-oxoacid:acceptor oxidoreductase family protein [Archaeoglobaceae archaeon]MCX8152751.1 2-oxoacid:acceptor oxidoreductase family protein [Archaeoglobaceae archaeon]MDW8013458.1 2-oxoacid:acceptor oxidoreductase family protein [Archaeoglobaceae archaeon]